MAIDISLYGGEPPEGYPGQLSDMNPIRTAQLPNEAAAVIDFGAAVADSLTQRACHLPAADTDRIVGLAIRIMSKMTNADGTVSYKQGDVVSVLRSGGMFCLPGEATTKGAQVVWITAQGRLGSGNPGPGRLAVPNAEWRASNAANVITRVYINN